MNGWNAELEGQDVRVDGGTGRTDGRELPIDGRIECAVGCVGRKA